MRDGRRATLGSAIIGPPFGIRAAMLRVGLKVKKDGEKFWMFTVAGSLGIAFCRSGFTMTRTGTVPIV